MIALSLLMMISGVLKMVLKRHKVPTYGATIKKIIPLWIIRARNRARSGTERRTGFQNMLRAPWDDSWK